ncbi:MAG TPA: hydantoinase B/oxoprolinase family protein [Pirellulaceae bacterium]|jgi:5-oxoprolinase (ATP-hydrolysing)|nr:hydantoinase B/oxoprolinase family protein [Pirellulaceae bacterium]
MAEETFWEFWLDVGGTFTDCVARSPTGDIRRAKILSSGRIRGEASRIEGTRLFDRRRRIDGALDLWKGYRFRPVASCKYTDDGAGDDSFTLLPPRIVASGPGWLDLSRELTKADGVDPTQPGFAYELDGGEPAPIAVIRSMLGKRLDQPLEDLRVRLGTTRGTNALLTRTGAPTLFAVTEGFGDLLLIGDQTRPRLFDLEIVKPPPLYAQVVEIPERLDATGQILKPLDAEAVRRPLQDLYDSGMRSLAICLMHAWRNPVHERIVAEVARSVGFLDVHASHETSPLARILPRAQTTVLDAYLTPVLRSYLDAIGAKLPGCDLRIMTSAGGLVPADAFSGKDSLLSGPAGGAVGYARIAEAAGRPRAIGFDMGGTSADVSRYDGRLEMQFETTKAGVPITTPTLAIETVAAGGGSICRFDGMRLRVGPESAGADPGPACYGAGGPLCVTDLNVWLGRVPEDRFPITLDRDAIERRLEEVRAAMLSATGVERSFAEIAAGFLDIANQTMAQAVRTISLARGHSLEETTLIPFGGAAGQHACAVAEALGLTEILFSPDAGVLSAYGIGMADAVRSRALGVYEEVAEKRIATWHQALASQREELEAELSAEGFPRELQEFRPLAELRYVRTEAALTLPWEEGRDLAERFAEAHRNRFGWAKPEAPVELATLRTEAVGLSRERPPQIRPVGAIGGKMQSPDASSTPPVHDGESLQPGRRLCGPAVVALPTSTIWLAEGWIAETLSDGTLLAKRTKSRTATANPQEEADFNDLVASLRDDPVALELWHRRFASIAEEMGVALRQTSLSVNVRERLDFSCALFDAEGSLVVNAPHVPVHLGAMSLTIKDLLRRQIPLAPGDVLATNDPFSGGSHLPDVTTVTPVFNPQGGRLLFFTASRAHHAEIGGIAPGSMPPFSKRLAEEGVFIPWTKIVEAGQPRWDDVRSLLSSGEHPSRNPEENVQDLQAQVAANHRGASALLSVVNEQGAERTLAAMRALHQAAARKMRQTLASLPDQGRKFSDAMEDGSLISVSTEKRGERLTIDFVGSAPVHPGNLNANPAIVRACVLYVLRSLIEEDVPLNDGILEPVEIRVPPGMLAPPAHPRDDGSLPAVAGGNVETSQRIVDVLLGALGRAAASQGTMNNFLFGDPTFGYYETICGGAGATERADGASAVHTHMTNTRLTDPEILEMRYPVRLEEFRIRRGSGGAGRTRGGDGVRRVLTFLRSLDVSLLTSRRRTAPYGLAGGEAGQPGINLLVHANGKEFPAPGSFQGHVHSGDRIVIETPGGGGFGRSAEQGNGEGRLSVEL